MSLPSKFVLAFPYEGQTYIHYYSYWVDLAAWTIVFLRSTHANNVAGLSFHMEWEGRSSDVLRQRIEGKPKHAFEKRFVTNGILKDAQWRYGHIQWSKEDMKVGNYPIRFKPVSVNFASHCITDEKVQEDEEFNQTETEIDEMLRKSCNDDRFWYSDGRKVLTIKHEARQEIISVLERAFVRMSLTQVVMTTKSRWRHYEKAKSLLQIYDRETPKYLYKQYEDNLNKVWLPPVKKTASSIEELKRRCAERFVRRHPTRATTNLLKMLAMKFKGI